MAQSPSPPPVLQSPPAVAPLETDRPDFTETPFAVPTGSLQVESGVDWLKDEGIRIVRLPDSLFRLGVSETTELRFVAPSYQRWRGAESASQFGDIQAGLKQELPWKPAKVDLALMPMITIPTGADKVSANAVEGEMVLLWDRKLPRGFSMGGNLEVGLARQNGESIVTFVPTLVLEREFTRKFAALVEYRGTFDDKGKAGNFLQYALTYKVRPLHQLDVRFGHALSGDATSLLVGVGYSFRVDGLFK